MPSIIVSTTPGALEEALRAVIVAIVPSEASHRDAGWTPMEDNRTESSSSTVPRLFQTEILTGDIVPGGLTGNGDSEVFLAFDVIADYRAFEEQELGPIVSHDKLDLYEALHEAINVVPGLTQVTMDGDPSPDGNEDEARYRFPFMLQFMWGRRF